MVAVAGVVEPESRDIAIVALRSVCRCRAARYHHTGARIAVSAVAAVAMVVTMLGLESKSSAIWRLHLS